MKTIQETENIISQLESMTELELAPICEALKNYCANNHMSHLMNMQDDEVSELEEKIETLASQRNSYQDRAYKAEKIIEQIRDLL